MFLEHPEKKPFNKQLKIQYHHADVLDIMEMGKDSVMVIHGDVFMTQKKKQY